jgi:hypothetical protein
MVVLPAQAFGLTSGIEGGGFQLAYIDPGAGSFVIQALLATIAGIAVTGRIYWSKIKKILGMASVDDDEGSDADDE